MRGTGVMWMIVAVIVCVAVRMIVIMRGGVVAFCLLWLCVGAQGGMALGVGAGMVVVGFWGGRRHGQL